MRALGWFLAIVGSLAAGGAILMAVLRIGELYSGTLADPMGDGPEGEEVAADILKYVALAVPGVLASLLGFILIVRSRLKRSRARMATAAAARNSPDNIMNRLTPNTPNRIKVPGRQPGPQPTQRTPAPGKSSPPPSHTRRRTPPDEPGRQPRY